MTSAGPSQGQHIIITAHCSEANPCSGLIYTHTCTYAHAAAAAHTHTQTSNTAVDSIMRIYWTGVAKTDIMHIYSERKVTNRNNLFYNFRLQGIMGKIQVFIVWCDRTGGGWRKKEKKSTWEGRWGRCRLTSSDTSERQTLSTHL